MKRQQELDLGVKHHKGIKRSLEKAIDKKSKAARKRDASSYRDKVRRELNKLNASITLVLFDDHEIKNIAAKYDKTIAGFHRFAAKMVSGVHGSVDDIPFDLALDDCFNDMKVGDWKAMIAWIKEFMKSDTMSCERILIQNDHHRLYYNKMMDRKGTITWDQLLWIAANSNVSKKPDVVIDTILIGETDQKNWTPVQQKLLERAKLYYPNAKVIDVDAEE